MINVTPVALKLEQERKRQKIGEEERVAHINPLSYLNQAVEISPTSTEHGIGGAQDNTRDGKERRPLKFWGPFNDWWRAEYDRLGRRLTAEEIKAWFDASADDVWPEHAPTLQDVKVHAKCLRSLNIVREYFRNYRAHKKGAKASDAMMKRNSSSASEGFNLDEHSSDSPPQQADVSGHHAYGNIPKQLKYADAAAFQGPNSHLTPSRSEAAHGTLPVPQGVLQHRAAPQVTQQASMSQHMAAHVAAHEYAALYACTDSARHHTSHDPSTIWHNIRFQVQSGNEQRWPADVRTSMRAAAEKVGVTQDHAVTSPSIQFLRMANPARAEGMLCHVGEKDVVAPIVSRSSSQETTPAAIPQETTPPVIPHKVLKPVPCKLADKVGCRQTIYCVAGAEHTFKARSTTQQDALLQKGSNQLAMPRQMHIEASEKQAVHEEKDSQEGTFSHLDIDADASADDSDNPDDSDTLLSHLERCPKEHVIKMYMTLRKMYKAKATKLKYIRKELES